jgi:hypothetical protein
VVVVVEGGDGPAAAGNKVLAIDQQNIGPAIAVEIEERAACAERFGKILVAGAAGVVCEANTGLGGDVGKQDLHARGVIRDE